MYIPSLFVNVHSLFICKSTFPLYLYIYIPSLFVNLHSLFICKYDDGRLGLIKLFAQYNNQLYAASAIALSCSLSYKVRTGQYLSGVSMFYCNFFFNQMTFSCLSEPYIYLSQLYVPTYNTVIIDKSY